MTRPRFDGKVALVTGGASGIGAATVRALVAEGARVALLDVDAAAGDAVAAASGALFVRCDVSDGARWRAAVGRVVEQWGRLDLVHLNAGVTTRPAAAPLDDDILGWIDRGAYRRIMAVNADGVVFGLHAVVPALARGGGGAVVATASIAGLSSFAPDPFYTMTKYAVVGLVRSLAPSLRRRQIRLNAICPGGVDTPIIPDDFRAAGVALMPPAALAAAVLDLLASDAAGEIWVKPSAEVPAYRYEAAPIRLP
jgi:NAD(P)-dependent dehydrogenase (short-subunit alcohol dehydrogenase family)